MEKSGQPHALAALSPMIKKCRYKVNRRKGGPEMKKDVLEKTVTCCCEYSNTGLPSPQSAMLQTKLPQSNYLAYKATTYAVRSLSYRIKGPDFNCRHRQQICLVSKTSIPALRPTHPPNEWVHGLRLSGITLMFPYTPQHLIIVP
jgi:hypothetical protein